MRIALPYTLLLLFAVISPSGVDGALVFTETIDVSGNQGSPHVLPPFEVGINMIAGTLPPTGLVGDIDAYDLTLPPGMSIIDSTLTISAYTPSLAIFGAGGRADGQPGLVSGTVLFNGDGLISPNLSMASGTTGFYQFSPPRSNEIIPQFGGYAYSMSVTVVPEPSAFMFLSLLGFVGMGTRWWRTRRTQDSSIHS